MNGGCKQTGKIANIENLSICKNETIEKFPPMAESGPTIGGNFTL